MDQKLKALKVTDLKAILANANVSAPARATKNDLVARIIASKQALDAYAALYPADDLLAPPEEVDWDAEPAPVAAALPPSPQKPAPAPVAAVPEPEPTPVPASEPATAELESAPADPELEKRRARAARFGIPVVEPTAPKSKPPAQRPAKVNGVDPKKLEERAARFGLKPTQPQAASPAPEAKKRRGEKRPAPPSAEADDEELARRKKRAERFGISTKP